LTVKQKIKKYKKEEDEIPQGVVRWAVQVINQEDVAVALYDILTLVQRREDD
jgi:oxepin-CoA hydrolase/3-oxo-5,6-dehydrosuberyl-CoA semialdehyde dehydrogenase